MGTLRRSIAILRQLDKGPMTADEIARHVGVPFGAVYRHLHEMQALGLIAAVGHTHTSHNAPAHLYARAVALRLVDVQDSLRRAKVELCSCGATPHKAPSKRRPG